MDDSFFHPNTDEIGINSDDEGQMSPFLNLEMSINEPTSYVSKNTNHANLKGSWVENLSFDEETKLLNATKNNRAQIFEKWHDESLKYTKLLLGQDSSGLNDYPLHDIADSAIDILQRSFPTRVPLAVTNPRTKNAIGPEPKPSSLSRKFDNRENDVDHASQLRRQNVLLSMGSGSFHNEPPVESLHFLKKCHDSSTVALSNDGLLEFMTAEAIHNLKNKAVGYRSSNKLSSPSVAQKINLNSKENNKYSNSNTSKSIKLNSKQKMASPINNRDISSNLTSTISDHNFGNIINSPKKSVLSPQFEAFFALRKGEPALKTQRNSQVAPRILSSVCTVSPMVTEAQESNIDASSTLDNLLSTNYEDLTAYLEQNQQSPKRTQKSRAEFDSNQLEMALIIGNMWRESIKKVRREIAQENLSQKSPISPSINSPIQRNNNNDTCNAIQDQERFASSSLAPDILGDVAGLPHVLPHTLKYNEPDITVSDSFFKNNRIDTEKNSETRVSPNKISPPPSPTRPQVGSRPVHLKSPNQFSPSQTMRDNKNIPSNKIDISTMTNVISITENIHEHESTILESQKPNRNLISKITRNNNHTLHAKNKNSSNNNKNDIPTKICDDVTNTSKTFHLHLPPAPKGVDAPNPTRVILRNSPILKHAPPLISNEMVSTSIASLNLASKKSTWNPSSQKRLSLLSVSPPTAATSPKNNISPFKNRFSKLAPSLSSETKPDNTWALRVAETIDASSKLNHFSASPLNERSLVSGTSFAPAQFLIPQFERLTKNTILYSPESPKNTSIVKYSKNSPDKKVSPSKTDNIKNSHSPLKVHFSKQIASNLKDEMLTESHSFSQVAAEADEILSHFEAISGLNIYELVDAIVCQSFADFNKECDDEKRKKMMDDLFSGVTPAKSLPLAIRLPDTEDTFEKSESQIVFIIDKALTKIRHEYFTKKGNREFREGYHFSSGLGTDGWNPTSIDRALLVRAAHHAVSKCVRRFKLEALYTARKAQARLAKSSKLTAHDVGQKIAESLKLGLLEAVGGLRTDTTENDNVANDEEGIQQEDAESYIIHQRQEILAASHRRIEEEIMREFPVLDPAKDMDLTKNVKLKNRVTDSKMRFAIERILSLVHFYDHVADQLRSVQKKLSWFSIASDTKGINKRPKGFLATSESFDNLPLLPAEIEKIEKNRKKKEKKERRSEKIQKALNEKRKKESDKIASEIDDASQEALDEHIAFDNVAPSQISLSEDDLENDSHSSSSSFDEDVEWRNILGGLFRTENFVPDKILFKNPKNWVDHSQNEININPASNHKYLDIVGDSVDNHNVSSIQQIGSEGLINVLANDTLSISDVDQRSAGIEQHKVDPDEVNSNTHENPSWKRTDLTIMIENNFDAKNPSNTIGTVKDDDESAQQTLQPLKAILDDDLIAHTPPLTPPNFVLPFLLADEKFSPYLDKLHSSPPNIHSNDLNVNKNETHMISPINMTSKDNLLPNLSDSLLEKSIFVLLNDLSNGISAPVDNLAVNSNNHQLNSDFKPSNNPGANFKSDQNVNEDSSIVIQQELSSDDLSDMAINQIVEWRMKRLTAFTKSRLPLNSHFSNPQHSRYNQINSKGKSLLKSKKNKNKTPKSSVGTTSPFIGNSENPSLLLSDGDAALRKRNGNNSNFNFDALDSMNNILLTGKTDPMLFRKQKWKKSKRDSPQSKLNFTPNNLKPSANYGANKDGLNILIPPDFPSQSSRNNEESDSECSGPESEFSVDDEYGPFHQLDIRPEDLDNDSDFERFLTEDSERIKFPWEEREDPKLVYLLKKKMARSAIRLAPLYEKKIRVLGEMNLKIAYNAFNANQAKWVEQLSPLKRQIHHQRMESIAIATLENNISDTILIDNRSSRANALIVDSAFTRQFLSSLRHLGMFLIKILAAKQAAIKLKEGDITIDDLRHKKFSDLLNTQDVINAIQESEVRELQSAAITAEEKHQSSVSGNPDNETENSFEIKDTNKFGSVSRLKSSRRRDSAVSRPSLNEEVIPPEVFGKITQHGGSRYSIPNSQSSAPAIPLKLDLLSPAMRHNGFGSFGVLGVALQTSVAASNDLNVSGKLDETSPIGMGGSLSMPDDCLVTENDEFHQEQPSYSFENNQSNTRHELLAAENTRYKEELRKRKMRRLLAWIMRQAANEEDRLSRMAIATELELKRKNEFENYQNERKINQDRFQKQIGEDMMRRTLENEHAESKIRLEELNRIQQHEDERGKNKLRALRKTIESLRDDILGKLSNIERQRNYETELENFLSQIVRPEALKLADDEWKAHSMINQKSENKRMNRKKTQLVDGIISKQEQAIQTLFDKISQLELEFSELQVKKSKFQHGLKVLEAGMIPTDALFIPLIEDPVKRAQNEKIIEVQLQSAQDEADRTSNLRKRINDSIARLEKGLIKIKNTIDDAKVEGVNLAQRLSDVKPACRNGVIHDFVNPLISSVFDLALTIEVKDSDFTSKGTLDQTTLTVISNAIEVLDGNAKVFIRNESDVVIAISSKIAFSTPSLHEESVRLKDLASRMSLSTPEFKRQNMLKSIDFSNINLADYIISDSPQPSPERGKSDQEQKSIARIDDSDRTGVTTKCIESLGQKIVHNLKQATNAAESAVEIYYNLNRDEINKQLRLRRQSKIEAIRARLKKENGFISNEEEAILGMMEEELMAEDETVELQTAIEQLKRKLAAKKLTLQQDEDRKASLKKKYPLLYKNNVSKIKTIKTEPANDDKKETRTERNDNSDQLNIKATFNDAEKGDLDTKDDEVVLSPAVVLEQLNEAKLKQLSLEKLRQELILKMNQKKLNDEATLQMKKEDKKRQREKDKRALKEMMLRKRLESMRLAREKRQNAKKQERIRKLSMRLALRAQRRSNKGKSSFRSQGGFGVLEGDDVVALKRGLLHMEILLNDTASMKKEKNQISREFKVQKSKAIQLKNKFNKLMARAQVLFNKLLNYELKEKDSDENNKKLEMLRLKLVYKKNSISDSVNDTKKAADEVDYLHRRVSEADKLISYWKRKLVDLRGDFPYFCDSLGLDLFRPSELRDSTRNEFEKFIWAFSNNRDVINSDESPFTLKYISDFVKQVQYELANFQLQQQLNPSRLLIPHGSNVRPDSSFRNLNSPGIKTFDPDEMNIMTQKRSNGEVNSFSKHRTNRFSFEINSQIDGDDQFNDHLHSFATIHALEGDGDNSCTGRSSNIDMADIPDFKSLLNFGVYTPINHFMKPGEVDTRDGLIAEQLKIDLKDLVACIDENVFLNDRFNEIKKSNEISPLSNFSKNISDLEHSMKTNEAALNSFFQMVDETKWMNVNEGEKLLLLSSDMRQKLMDKLMNRAFSTLTVQIENIMDSVIQDNDSELTDEIENKNLLSSKPNAKLSLFNALSRLDSAKSYDGISSKIDAAFAVIHETARDLNIPIPSEVNAHFSSLDNNPGTDINSLVNVISRANELTLKLNAAESLPIYNSHGRQLDSRSLSTSKEAFQSNPSENDSGIPVPSSLVTLNDDVERIASKNAGLSYNEMQAEDNLTLIASVVNDIKQIDAILRSKSDDLKKKIISRLLTAGKSQHEIDLTRASSANLRNRTHRSSKFVIDANRFSLNGLTSKRHAKLNTLGLSPSLQNEFSPRHLSGLGSNAFSVSNLNISHLDDMDLSGVLKIDSPLKGISASSDTIQLDPISFKPKQFNSLNRKNSEYNASNPINDDQHNQSQSPLKSQENSAHTRRSILSKRSTNARSLWGSKSMHDDMEHDDGFKMVIPMQVIDSIALGIRHLINGSYAKAFSIFLKHLRAVRVLIRLSEDPTIAVGHVVFPLGFEAICCQIGGLLACSLPQSPFAKYRLALKHSRQVGRRSSDGNCSVLSHQMNEMNTEKSLFAGFSSAGEIDPDEANYNNHLLLHGEESNNQKNSSDPFSPDSEVGRLFQAVEDEESERLLQAMQRKASHFNDDDPNKLRSPLSNVSVSSYLFVPPDADEAGNLAHQPLSEIRKKDRLRDILHPDPFEDDIETYTLTSIYSFTRSGGVMRSNSMPSLFGPNAVEKHVVNPCLARRRHQKSHPLRDDQFWFTPIFVRKAKLNFDSYVTKIREEYEREMSYKRQQWKKKEKDKLRKWLNSQSKEQIRLEMAMTRRTLGLFNSNGSDLADHDELKMQQERIKSDQAANYNFAKSTAQLYLLQEHNFYSGGGGGGSESPSGGSSSLLAFGGVHKSLLVSLAKLTGPQKVELLKELEEEKQRLRMHSHINQRGKGATDLSRRTMRCRRTDELIKILTEGPPLTTDDYSHLIKLKSKIAVHELILKDLLDLDFGPSEKNDSNSLNEDTANRMSKVGQKIGSISAAFSKAGQVIKQKIASNGSDPFCYTAEPNSISKEGIIEAVGDENDDAYEAILRDILINEHPFNDLSPRTSKRENMIKKDLVNSGGIELELKIPKELNDLPNPFNEANINLTFSAMKAHRDIQANAHIRSVWRRTTNGTASNFLIDAEDDNDANLGVNNGVIKNFNNTSTDLSVHGDKNKMKKATVASNDNDPALVEGSLQVFKISNTPKVTKNKLIVIPPFISVSHSLEFKPVNSSWKSLPSFVDSELFHQRKLKSPVSFIFNNELVQVSEPQRPLSAPRRIGIVVPDGFKEGLFSSCISVFGMMSELLGLNEDKDNKFSRSSVFRHSNLPVSLGKSINYNEEGINSFLATHDTNFTDNGITSRNNLFDSTVKSTGEVSHIDLYHNSVSKSPKSVSVHSFSSQRSPPTSDQKIFSALSPVSSTKLKFVDFLNDGVCSLFSFNSMQVVTKASYNNKGLVHANKPFQPASADNIINQFFPTKSFKNSTTGNSNKQVSFSQIRKAPDTGFRQELFPKHQTSSERSFDRILSIMTGDPVRKETPVFARSEELDKFLQNSSVDASDRDRIKRQINNLHASVLSSATAKHSDSSKNIETSHSGTKNSKQIVLRKRFKTKSSFFSVNDKLDSLIVRPYRIGSYTRFRSNDNPEKNNESKNAADIADVLTVSTLTAAVRKLHVKQEQLAQDDDGSVVHPTHENAHSAPASPYSSPQKSLNSTSNLNISYSSYLNGDSAEYSLTRRLPVVGALEGLRLSSKGENGKVLIEKNRKFFVERHHKRTAFSKSMPVNTEYFDAKTSPPKQTTSHVLWSPPSRGASNSPPQIRSLESASHIQGKTHETAQNLYIDDNFLNPNQVGISPSDFLIDVPFISPKIDPKRIMSMRYLRRHPFPSSSLSAQAPALTEFSPSVAEDVNRQSRLDVQLQKIEKQFEKLQKVRNSSTIVPESKTVASSDLIAEEKSHSHSSKKIIIPSIEIPSNLKSPDITHEDFVGKSFQISPIHILKSPRLRPLAAIFDEPSISPRLAVRLNGRDNLIVARRKMHANNNIDVSDQTINDVSKECFAGEAVKNVSPPSILSPRMHHSPRLGVLGKSIPTHEGVVTSSKEIVKGAWKLPPIDNERNK